MGSIRPRGLAQTQDCDQQSGFVALLRTCTKNKELSRGSSAHHDIVRKGLLETCSDTLVTMYAKCGVLTKARDLFDLHKSRNVYTWTALIAGFVEKGQGDEALLYFELMEQEGLAADAVMYSYVLKACGIIRALDKGEKIHNQIAKEGSLCDNVVLGTALVDMYAKCGALVKAQRVLEDLRSRNVVSWTSLIVGYAEHGKGEQALKCFEHMQQEGFLPNAVTYAGVLTACGSISALKKGQNFHNEISKQGFLLNDIVLGTSLVDMYVKCSAPAKARQVLEELSIWNVIPWNAVIAGYAEVDEGDKAIECFNKMKCEGLSPDATTYTCVLKVYGGTKAVDMGKKIHREIAKVGLLGSNVVLGTALIDMYAKCGAISKAWQVLKELPVRDVISWNALIAGCADHGKCEQAMILLRQMQHEGLSPQAGTFICILKACGSIKAADSSEKVHEEVAKQGLLENDVVLGGALVDAYAKCGAFTKAQRVLQELSVRNVVLWNALISGYVDHGKGGEALICYEQMQREGISPDAVTFICLLKACGSVGAADKGEKIYSEMRNQGLLRGNIVLGNALVNMYAKCGALAKAIEVFEELPVRDVITWNALITGFAEQGEGEQALKYYEKMKQDGFSPDAVTYIGALKACGSIGAIDKGEKIHRDVAKQRLLANNIVLGNMLVDMYAKCGALAKAREVLQELCVRNVISWTSLISRYAEHGEREQVLSCLEQMHHEGLSPNASTISCILSACSRLGLVDDAQMYILHMSSHYGMKPDLEHYTSLIDLFGRTGHLRKAMEVMERLPFSDVAVWLALLGACRKWVDVEVGRWAFERAVQEHKSDALVYALMADICTAAGTRQEDIEASKRESVPWKSSCGIELAPNGVRGTDQRHFAIS